ncbi:MAG: ABC transporter ATP-binding protein [Gammaproteobacteria bacterium RIFCSPHIGHO2_12_FULL_35_23]|nr:MAG: ABC transporter ATP-binding protein [Gammaproteobacteria bacterium RIFCSPHIGHO2_12_FULL_35_23]
MSNIVTISNLSFKRGERSIFDNVNIVIPQGKITTIMGPSGTGKTTLLKLIGAQLRPNQGSVIFDGEDVHQLSRNALYRARRKMGMLFQSGALFTNLSVFDNIAFPLLEHTNLSKRMVRDLVLMKLEAVGLRGAESLMPNELSGGMARRVALARAIALDPKIIMYDEPFTGQDPITMGVLIKLIKMLNDSLSITSVLVSHDVQEAASISDYIYLLSGGKVIGEGTPKDLFVSDQPEVKQFMLGLPDGPVPFHYPSKDFKTELLGAVS